MTCLHSRIFRNGVLATKQKAMSGGERKNSISGPSKIQLE
jgi:hypothetical protein